jgi:transcription elongation factor Elf1
LITSLNEFTICPNCGSPEYMENYPTSGTSICAKCAHEIIKIPLKEMSEEDILKQNCPFCGKEGEEDDTVFDKNNIMVFKCKGCGKLDGYWVTLQPTDTADGSINTKKYKPKPVSLYKLEGNLPVYSEERAKEIARAIKKIEKNPKKQCEKKFKLLVHEKLYLMQQKGITSKNIERATTEASHFINRKGPFTKKQLESLLTAAILLAQDDLIRIGNFKSAKVTERQMENIFDVDRKTMRKWKKTLRENHDPLRLIVYAHIGMDESADRKAEIPQDLRAVRKLENPKKGKCDFCEQNKLLVWQLEYTGALWNKICQESYERLKGYSLKEEWKIQNL